MSPIRSPIFRIRKEEKEEILSEGMFETIQNKFLVRILL